MKALKTAAGRGGKNLNQNLTTERVGSATQKVSGSNGVLTPNTEISTDEMEVSK